MAFGIGKTGGGGGGAKGARAPGERTTIAIMVNAITLNLTPTIILILNLNLILTLPWTKNPIITLALTYFLLEISPQEEYSPEQLSNHRQGFKTSHAGG